jgi:hypothetical protein
VSLDDQSQDSAAAKRRARELRKDSEARKASSQAHMRDTRERLERGVDRDALDDEDRAARD